MATNYFLKFLKKKFFFARKLSKRNDIIKKNFKMLFQYQDISYAVCYVLSDYVNTCLIRNEEEELID